MPDETSDMIRLQDELLALRQRVGEYDFVLQNIRQGIWRLDERDVVTEANPYLCEWLERPLEAIVGHGTDEFVLDRRPYIVDGQIVGDRYEADFATALGIVRRAIVVRARLNSGAWIEVITDVTAEHAIQEKLVREVQEMSALANRDPLTGLINRRGFERALARCIRQASRTPFGLVLLDLDGFKAVNDHGGHAVGDLQLIDFAARLKERVRQLDLVARIGGDEFLVLASGISHEELRDLARRMRPSLGFTAKVGDRVFPIGCSVGWAHSDEGLDDMLGRADVRMYRQKIARRRRLTHPLGPPARIHGRDETLP